MKNTKFPIDFPIDFSIGRDITWPKKATEKPAAAHDPATGRQDKVEPAKNPVCPVSVIQKWCKTRWFHSDIVVTYHFIGI
jgi:hypothetical protein